MDVPVGILNNVMFNLNYLCQLFARRHHPRVNQIKVLSHTGKHWGVETA